MWVCYYYLFSDIVYGFYWCVYIEIYIMKKMVVDVRMEGWGKVMNITIRVLHILKKYIKSLKKYIFIKKFVIFTGNL